MAHQRGEYRSIRRVLLDGPDFQHLPERARFLFIVLKLNVGPTGIDVQYPAALAIQLEAQTGMPLDAVYDSLAALERSGWIRREANVLWVVGHLENDPHMKASDEKHRKAVVKHLAGLPRLDIVRAFIKANPDFFPASDGPSTSLGWAIEGPSKGHRSREREREREKEVPPAGAVGAKMLDSWTARLAALWSADVGDVKPGRLGAALKPAVDRHGVERVERAMRAYVVTQKAAGKPCRLSWFADESQVWIDRTASPLEVIDGEMSPTLELLTRPAKGAA